MLARDPAALDSIEGGRGGEEPAKYRRDWRCSRVTITAPPSTGRVLTIGLIPSQSLMKYLGTIIMVAGRVTGGQAIEALQNRQVAPNQILPISGLTKPTLPILVRSQRITSVLGRGQVAHHQIALHPAPLPHPSRPCLQLRTVRLPKAPHCKHNVSPCTAPNRQLHTPPTLRSRLQTNIPMHQM